ncbi:MULTISPECIES: FMN-binding protein [Bacteroides]|uniref:FMN-binding protein n=1 Tax=Bacteroides TaxID=816 RepID=UPI0004B933C7|nr:FMN-binding protein [Bacteroides neonati]
MSQPIVLQSSPYTDKIIGFAGPTPLEITLNDSGKISDIKLLKNKDTPAYVQIAIDGGLLNAWNGLTPQEALAKQVDAVSGATFSSRGIIQTVQKRLEVYEAQRSSATTSQVLIGISLFVLIAVGYFFMRNRRKHRMQQAKV